MERIRVSPLAPEAGVERAAAVLKAGGLVAFPTETVYGLGANALDPAALERIYQAKGRPAFNPVIVHVPDVAAARRLAAEWPETAERLARRWWPGPLTLVVRKAPQVPDRATAGRPTVALRVPDHPIALALLARAGLPVAAPSANRSGEVSPTTAEHVARGLGNQVDVLLDGGPTAVGIESTVVDLSGAEPILLRPGIITREALEAEIGPIGTPAIPGAATEPRSSPGLLDRHYAPKARLVLVPASPDQVAGAVARGLARGERVGALLRVVASPPGVHARVLPEDATGYARELYHALHGLDDAGMSLVVVEQVPDEPAWEGVRDRLSRAAAPPPQGEPGA